MNKAELVNVIAEKAGMTKVDAKKAVEAFIEASTQSEASFAFKQQYAGQFHTIEKIEKV